MRNWLQEAGESALTDEYAKNFYYSMRQSSQGQKYELPDINEPDAMVNLLTSCIFTVTA